MFKLLTRRRLKLRGRHTDIARSISIGKGIAMMISDQSNRALRQCAIGRVWVKSQKL